MKLLSYRCVNIVKLWSIFLIPCGHMLCVPLHTDIVMLIKYMKMLREWSFFGYCPPSSAHQFWWRRKVYSKIYKDMVYTLKVFVISRLVKLDWLWPSMFTPWLWTPFPIQLGLYYKMVVTWLIFLLSLFFSRSKGKI